MDEKTELQKTLSLLPQGYISKKRINGKEYSYLQQRRNGKISSTYIPDDSVGKTVAEISKRKECLKRLSAVCDRMERLEKAAALLGGAERRRLSRIKLCAGMDSLSVEEKKNCISFGSAMNAIEGVSAAPVVEDALADWVHGQKAYFDVLTDILRHYGCPDEAL